MEGRKSRNLPILDYLEVLIKEYFIADTRRKIYPRRDDREYWAKVASGKKDKIIDITARNQIPNVFDDTDTKKKYYSIYFPPDRIPYVILNDKDLKSYFRTGAEVIITSEPELTYGIVSTADLHTKEVVVNLHNDQGEQTYRFHQVRRVL